VKQDSSSDRPAPKPSGLRRIPQQERGIKTIEVILKAAGQEIDRGGLTKLTTKRIADVAGLSIGALYEYFPNKEAVVHALASQWLEQIKDAIAAVHPARTGCNNLLQYVDMVYAAVKPHYQQVPGVSGLITVLSSVPELKALEDDIDLQVNGMLADAIYSLVPHVDAIQCMTMARTLTILDHYLLIESTLRDPGKAALYDDHRRVCQYALVTNIMLMNERARATASSKR
jgi:AcrR family transcriptional regulator